MLKMGLLNKNITEYMYGNALYDPETILLEIEILLDEIFDIVYKFYEKILATICDIIGENVFGLQKKIEFLNKLSPNEQDIINRLKIINKDIISKLTGFRSKNLFSSVISCRNKNNHDSNIKLNITIENKSSNVEFCGIKIIVKIDTHKSEILKLIGDLNDMLKELFLYFNEILENKQLFISKSIYAIIYDCTDFHPHILKYSYNIVANKYILEQYHNIITNTIYYDDNDLSFTTYPNFTVPNNILLYEDIEKINIKNKKINNINIKDILYHNLTLREIIRNEDINRKVNVYNLYREDDYNKLSAVIISKFKYPHNINEYHMHPN